VGEDLDTLSQGLMPFRKPFEAFVDVHDCLHYDARAPRP
jgi:hypothetical protein